MLASLYSGIVTIWNYESQTVVKTLEVSDMPVRAAKFIARKSWIICGTDDLIIRVYNYNTLEKVAQFEGHTDYIRAFSIHPTRPFVLSCSDDMSVRLWDWEKQWKCVTTYEGHNHYVMAVAFNPKDPNTFATASLDCSIKIWGLGSEKPNYTLEGHEKGVNCLDYYVGGDRPYLVSGADDSTVRVWDYQTKACVRVLEGHGQNVSSVLFHPDLPLIITASEDGTVKVWSSKTFRAEATFNFSMERIWSLAIHRGSTEIAVGCDEGSVVMSLGKGEPAASMDSNNGKLIWAAKNNEIQSANILQTFEENPNSLPSDGERLVVSGKELGQSEMFPQQISHNPSGRLVAVTGDGEYVIYSALAWRNRSFGKGLEVVWILGDNTDYAVREGPTKIGVFRNFNEVGCIRAPSACDRIFGGALIGAACSGGLLCFYDWNSLELVRRIEVEAKRVIWSSNGSKVAICSEDSIFILNFNMDLFRSMTESRQQHLSEEDFEQVFELIDEIDEKASSGLWINDCFIFVTVNNRICYSIGGQIFPIAIAQRPTYLCGFLSEVDRLVCVDKDANVTTFSLSLTTIRYECAILQGDLEVAQQLEPHIPSEQANKVAQFLASQGHVENAFAMATDVEFKFDLAVQLKRLDAAYELAMLSESTHKWRQLGDAALAEWKIALAEKCYLKSHDLESLLALYSSSGKSDGLLTLASMAMKRSRFNIAFTCFFATGHREECFDLLLKTNRIPEAAIFARTYLPSAIERATSQWRQLLQEKKHRAATLIADPVSNAEMFPDYENSLRAQEGTIRIGTDSIRSRSVSFDSSSQQMTTAVPISFSLDNSFDQNTFNQPATNNPAYDAAAYSDHMSMDVNMGTGSMRADDLDDLASVSAPSEYRDELLPVARNLENLSIQELEEEHQEEASFPPMSEHKKDGQCQGDKECSLDYNDHPSEGKSSLDYAHNQEQGHSGNVFEQQHYGHLTGIKTKEPPAGRDAESNHGQGHHGDVIVEKGEDEQQESLQDEEGFQTPIASSHEELSSANPVRGDDVLFDEDDGWD